VPVDPNERLREADRLFATCMALVRQTTHPDRAFLPFDKDEREAYFWLVEHLDLLTEQLRKSIVADAGNILGRWADLPKSPLGSQKDEIRLFLSVWQGLPKGVTNRVIKQVFRKNHTWLGHNAGDIRWVREIYPAIGDKHARAALYEGIAGGASAFGTVDDPDKLLVHAECLAVYARHEYVLLDYKLGTVTRAYQQLAADGVPDDKHNVMNEIATVIASIPDMVARREAAVEERRRELDRMFRWNSDLEPESKAA
jgi:hypothetical protein